MHQIRAELFFLPLDIDHDAQWNGPNGIIKLNESTDVLY